MTPFEIEDDPLLDLTADVLAHVTDLRRQLVVTDCDAAFAFGADALLSGILVVAAGQS